MPNRSRRTWGTIFFVAGVLAGLGLAIASVWGDFEATSYFRTGATYGPFSGLHCPILMSRSDVAQISATFENPMSKTIEPYYQIQVSGLSAQRRMEQQIEIAPHASETVKWTADARDIDLGWFVMTKVTVLPFVGNPTRQATCGMVVLSVGGLTGGEILGLGLGISLIGIVLGLALREGKAAAASPRETTLRNGMRAAGVAVLLAMLGGFLGAWMLGLIFSAITILLMVILLRVAGG